MSEVKLPFIGKVKTGWAIAGGGLVLGITGYAWYRHRQGAAAAAGAGVAAGPGTDPATGYPYGSAEDEAALAGQGSTTGAAGTDPQTGYPYGSAEDEEALAELEGGGGYYGGGGGGYYDEILPTPSPSPAPGPGPGTFTTNAEWIAWCEENVTGYTPEQIQGALAAAEARVKVTQTQLTIFQVCIAVGGEPPTPIPTPKVRTTGTGGTGTKVRVPDIKGDDLDTAHVKLKAAGLAYNADATSQKKGYHRIVTAQDPAAGAEADKGAHVAITWHYVKVN